MIDRKKFEIDNWRRDESGKERRAKWRDAKRKSIYKLNTKSTTTCRIQQLKTKSLSSFASSICELTLIRASHGSYVVTLMNADTPTLLNARRWLEPFFLFSRRNPLAAEIEHFDNIPLTTRHSETLAPGCSTAVIPRKVLILWGIIASVFFAALLDWRNKHNIFATLLNWVNVCDFSVVLLNVEKVCTISLLFY